MTHPWPNHGDPNCHECAVLDRCLAQFAFGTEWGTRTRIEWLHDRGYSAAKATCGAHEEPEKWHATLRHCFARQVCARLIAWVRWRGERADVQETAHVQEAVIPWDTHMPFPRTAHRDDLENWALGRLPVQKYGPLILDISPWHEAGGLWVKWLDAHPSAAPSPGGDGLWTFPAERWAHPLDGTPVAGLRSPFTQSGPLEPGCRTVLTGRGPDWPALAEIAAYLDLSGPLLDFAIKHHFVTADQRHSAGMQVARDYALSLGMPVASPSYDDDGNIDEHAWDENPGLWAEVHARRPVEYGPGVAERILPYQMQVDHALGGQSPQSSEVQSLWVEIPQGMDPLARSRVLQNRITAALGAPWYAWQVLACEEEDRPAGLHSRTRYAVKVIDVPVAVPVDAPRALQIGEWRFMADSRQASERP